MNDNILLKSIFPIALENGDGWVHETRGTAYLLHYNGTRFIVTAWHCIRNIIKHCYAKIGIIDDNNISHDMIKSVIEENCSFGFTGAPNCWRIPINFVHRAIEKNVGKIFDILFLCIDEERLKNNKGTSLSGIEALNLSTQPLRIGSKYKIYGYPDAEMDKENKIIRLSSRYLCLINIKSENVEELELEQGLLSFEQNDCHATFNGYSGGAVLDGNNDVLGMIIRASDDEKCVRFITSRTLIRMLQQITQQDSE